MASTPDNNHQLQEELVFTEKLTAFILLDIRQAFDIFIIEASGILDEALQRIESEEVHIQHIDSCSIYFNWVGMKTFSKELGPV